MTEKRKYGTFMLTWGHVERFPGFTRAFALAECQKIVEESNLEWYVVALEEYKEGEGAQWPPDHASGGGPDELPPSDKGWHIHMACKLKKQMQRRVHDVGAPFIVQGIHPDVKKDWVGAYGWQNAVKYAIKDDKFPLTNIPDIFGFLKKVKEKGPSKFTLVAAMLDQGLGPKEIKEAEPAFYLMNSKKIKDVYDDIKRFKSYHVKEPWAPLDLEGLRGASRKVGEWLNENIGVDRPFKKKQLYLWGPPNTGKTTLLIELEKYLTVMTLNQDEAHFFDGYDDNETQLLCIDEFKGQWRPTLLNRLLQGGPHMGLNVKGGTTWKTKNQPFIILTNTPFDGQYVHAKDRDAVEGLRARLEIVEISPGASIKALINRMRGVELGDQYLPVPPPVIGGAMSAERDRPADAAHQAEVTYQRHMERRERMRRLQDAQEDDDSFDWENP